MGSLKINIHRTFVYGGRRLVSFKNFYKALKEATSQSYTVKSRKLPARRWVEKLKEPKCLVRGLDASMTPKNNHFLIKSFFPLIGSGEPGFLALYFS